MSIDLNNRRQQRTAPMGQIRLTTFGWRPINQKAVNLYFEISKNICCFGFYMKNKKVIIATIFFRLKKKIKGARHFSA